ncbi:hypothetical protein FIBSPDRAFT_957992 [Athelia psychrophila]|uniref:Novel STAND NTPase 1 domain-containing protein n=1 Tax=Athelia psychrophila TaxID=1759441 RepID=A0A166F4G8_9AGAM|nr:hypothetical protein FIBSPDRAFT_957992 [Fibularhizoctonia sp. CBS 109695]
MLPSTIYPHHQPGPTSCPPLFGPTWPPPHAHRAAALNNVDIRTKTTASLSCLPLNPPPATERLPFVAEPHLHTFDGSELETRVKKSLQAPSPDVRHRNFQGAKRERCSFKLRVHRACRRAHTPLRLEAFGDEAFGMWLSWRGRYRRMRKQLRLQDDRDNIGNRMASTAIQTANTTSFHTIGALGPVTNVAGHIFHGNVNMYNGASVPPSSLSVSPPSQPSPPDIWFGRDEIVSTLAGIITVNENPRLAILGAGGMGKTSTALHVIHHQAVVARYKDRIFFVACDAATSANLLALHILQVVGVSMGAGENPVTALHLALKHAPPTLLLLDNFESLWEAEKVHNATRDLLQKIANSPSSTLIITMRATTPPPGVRWTFFESLPPLRASSAKDIFLAINATFCDGSDDGNEVLDELLMELDYVPLAIHLLGARQHRYPPTVDKLESVEGRFLFLHHHDTFRGPTSKEHSRV